MEASYDDSICYCFLRSRGDATVMVALVFAGHFLEAGRYDKAYEQRHREQAVPIRVLAPGREGQRRPVLSRARSQSSGNWSGRPWLPGTSACSRPSTIRRCATILSGVGCWCSSYLVVATYFQSHPERLQEEGQTLALDALPQAFSCKQW